MFVKLELFFKSFIFLVILNYEVNGFSMLSCNRTEYFDPGLMVCQPCPANVSMVASPDGFSCTCEEHAVPVGPARCKPCSATEVVSADGASCVPRKCQGTGGRYVCRKCPPDYISVTQNLDGTPTKEVVCVRCARGYRASNNACVRCWSCACARGDVAVAGACVPAKHLATRPKYEDNRLHPNALLEIVKLEYLCMKDDLLACRQLASVCVRNFYLSDLAGPCRLWIQPKTVPPKGLPDLLIKPSSNDFNPGEFVLPRGKDSLSLVTAVYTANGGFKVLKSPLDLTTRCSLPAKIKIGDEFSQDCHMNITQWSALEQNSTFAPFLDMDGVLKPLPVSVRTSSGHYVQAGTWNSKSFRRYFLIDNFHTLATNITGTVYLRTMLIRFRIARDKQQVGSLRLHVLVEVQYENKPPHKDTVTTTITVKNDMPNAGIYRVLEIWGGVLGSLLSLYALVQWRGEMRRGGLHFSFVPLMASAISDALFFAAWFSTLHALAAEAGALGMTLPLSRGEERIIKAFLYSAVSLKVIKVVWVNWKQCRNDIFFLDWLEYNSPIKDASQNNDNNWRSVSLAREWSRLQTIRRVPPSYTVTLSLFALQLMTPWQSYLPRSQGYRWAIATIAWLSSYVLLSGSRWVLDKVAGSPFNVLPRVCGCVGLSLLVFQEENYAHYVHGRNDDCKDLRMMAGPLSMCRVVMAAPLRVVYKQLSTTGIDDLGNVDARRVVLTRLLAAFFERALDGLNWVACERTIPERLLDVELTEREAGTTSVLLYDPDEGAPSCAAVTWWGEEWTLATFDVMLFGTIVIATDNAMLAAFVTIIVWQIMKWIRLLLGNKNQTYKTNVEFAVNKYK